MQRRGLSDEFQAKHHRISSERSREFVDEAFVRERGLRGIDRAPSTYRNRRLCHDVFDPKVRRSIGYVIRRLGRPLVQTALNVLRLPPPFPRLIRHDGEEEKKARRSDPSCSQTYGSVRGAASDGRPYRDSWTKTGLWEVVRSLQATPLKLALMGRCLCSARSPYAHKEVQLSRATLT
jgi:hypothetical protein